MVRRSTTYEQHTEVSWKKRLPAATLGIPCIFMCMITGEMAPYRIVGSQAFHIHFLGLGFHCQLVADDGLDYLGVKVDGGQNWQGKVAEKSVEDETLGHPIFRQVVVAASDQLSFCNEKNNTV